MSNFWDLQETIGTLEKNKRENIVISKCKRNNKEYLDVRIHAKTKDSDNYVPTSKGFNIESIKTHKLLDILKHI